MRYLKNALLSIGVLMIISTGIVGSSSEPEYVLPDYDDLGRDNSAIIQEVIDLYNLERFEESKMRAKKLVASGRLSEQEELFVTELLAYSYIALSERNARGEFRKVATAAPDYELSTEYGTPEANTVWMEVYQEKYGELPDQELTYLGTEPIGGH